MAPAPKKDNKISLTISTLSGDFKDEFPPKQTLQHVVDRAIKKLELQGEGPWILELGGNELALTLTIEDAGLADGAVLTLNPQEGGGGARRQ